MYKLLGIDASKIPEDAEITHTFTNLSMLESWRGPLFFAVAALAVFGVFWLYRREIETAPRRVRTFLGVVRCLVLIVLALVLLGPAVSFTTKTYVRPYVLVLIDESASMGISDRYIDDAAVQPVVAAVGGEVEDIRRDKPKRTVLIRKLLEKNDNKFLRDLLDRGDLMVMTFSDRANAREATQFRKSAKPEKVESLDGASGSVAQPIDLPELKSAGQGTNLAKALRDALKHAAGTPIAGVVILSDGQHTAAHDDPLIAAQLASDQKVPIFAVGVGDASKPQNMTVADLLADQSVWRGDPFTLQAIIKHRGMKQSQVTVELVAQEVTDQGEPGPEKTVDRKPLTLTGGAASADGDEVAGQQSISFEHLPEKAGRYKYTARIAAQPNETRDDDNESSAHVNVRSEQARVLLVSGGPSWEYRFLQALLRRDKTINVSCWLQSMDVDMPQEGNTIIKRLPKSAEDLFKYDAVVMLDPDPLEFNEEWLALMKTYLGEHGGGLLYMAGPKHAGRFLISGRTRGVRQLLPVEFANLASMDVQSLIKSFAKQWPLRAVAANLDHPILGFTSDMRVNQARWDKMPGVYWSFPASQAIPAARVLIEHGDPSLRSRDGRRPLVVAGQYGPGRTVYTGFDSTWRWRRVGKENEYYNKYWIQTVRYLVDGRLMRGKRRGFIQSSGDAFFVGDNVKITATLYDQRYQPLSDPEVTLEVKQPDGRRRMFQLKPVKDKPGVYEESIPATQVGLNELAIRLAGDDGSSVSITSQFEVNVPDVEQRETWLNRALLEDMAETSGGRYVDVNEMSAIAGLITRQPEVRVRPGKPIELWDTNRLLILLVVLLTIEWAFRKKYKLM